MKWREEVDRGEHSLMTDPGCAAQNDDVRHAWSRILCLLFIHPPAHGSEVSPASRNTLDSARIPRASKLLICGLFLKVRVLAQDGIETRPTERTSILASTVSGSSRSLPHRAPRGRIHSSKG